LPLTPTRPPKKLEPFQFRLGLSATDPRKSCLSPPDIPTPHRTAREPRAKEAARLLIRMAPPAPPAGAGAGACELLPAAPAHAPEAPPPQDHVRDVVVAKGRGHGRPRPQGAGARILSLGVQAAVMGAAIAIFLLFAAASALLLLVLVVAARAFRHHHGSRYRVPSLDYYPSSSTAPPTPLRPGLSHADLRRLPCFAFPSGGSSSDNTACAVCLEAATAGERWRAMPACRHAFHAACVDRWLARSPACPVCRAAVAAPTS
jgi:E3 ubiquitin-protein ligase RNF38/44